MMSGVPNVAFTEALAFLFQSRDLYLLDIKQPAGDADKMQALNAAWSLMEIMGVSMVEMKMWKWLYENPDATPASLKEATLIFAVEVWNKYFAPVMGTKDSPILAIYSHMVEVPLYLPNYAYGQIIEDQIENYIRDKKFPDEVDRIFKQGRLTPQQWMQAATGQKISAQPLIESLEKALN
jgi:oligoendopeptidase F